MVGWIQVNERLLWASAAVSIVVFVVTLIAVPWLVVRIPSDYFARGRRRRKLWTGYHPVARAVWLIGKNVLGYVFVLAGTAMLVLPGQGLMTILVGIMLLDFPGKYRLERCVVARRPVLRSINWLRQRAGRSPLALEE
ncbi:MAG: hypothetical protein A2V70_13015 [Planctomycetes bacterium RBG_13_63_9]|nr:MAG: hypothetical protein A2V70_13015 [Planctomycetes bacterium RBG_13_63_9]